MPKASDFLRPSQFKALSGLSDEELVELLQTGALEIKVDEKNRLHINKKNLTADGIAGALGEKKLLLEQDKIEELEEVIFFSIKHALSPIVEEAIELAVEKLLQKQESDT